MIEPFYMNFMEGGHAPSYQFTKQEDAEKEAARLAHAHQRNVYTLVAIVETAPKHNVVRTELKAKELTVATTS